jgi:RND family efflux transporter MFP subunit
MSRTRLSCVLAVLIALVPACGGHDHPHDDADHGDHFYDDLGPGEERPTVAVTHWTERTELFMEYPAFVAGESGRSAIHVTDLRDFSPLAVGEVVVGLRSKGGRVLELRGGPSRPGIFGVDLEVDRPGVYAMTLRVDAPDLQDLHELGPVTVHAPEAPLGTRDEEDGGAISFLKEQQWTLDFGTAPVETRSLRSSITVPAVVHPRSGGDALLSAPVPGRVDPASTVPLPGSRIRAGTVLTRIVPRSDDLRDAAGLRAAVAQAEQDHLLATRERDRAARLVAARALPSRRLDEAEAAVTVSEARLEAARMRWSRFEALSQAGGGIPRDGAFAVRAPFDGVVSDVRFAPGVSVEENQVLLRLVDSDHLHIVGNVPESRTATLPSVTAGELLREEEPPVALGEPIAIGHVVEPVARTTEVRFALDNSPPGLQIGQRVRLRLLLGDEESGPAIPESAVVDDGGRPVVFVQRGGESFERRPVQLGSREGGYVRVLEGVEPGERVVNRGAYLVRLAAMSTQIPAHGHVH